MKTLLVYLGNLLIGIDQFAARLFGIPYGTISAWMGEELHRPQCAKRIKIADFMLTLLDWSESYSHCKKWYYMREENKEYFVIRDGKIRTAQ